MNDLERFLGPEAHQQLQDWLTTRTDIPVSDGLRQREMLAQAALELTKMGTSVDDMTAYALDHVAQLYRDDVERHFDPDVTKVATAYGVVHNLGCGPVTLSIVRAVRDLYR